MSVGEEDSDPELDRFLMAYKDLGFGWHFVKTLADNELLFPATAYDQQDRYLWRAYLYNTNRQKYRDPDILEALSLTRNDTLSAYRRAVINALLVVEDITTEKIVKALRGSISEGGVEAYATCFFDIRGRKEDAVLLASMIYPNGRYVEFVKDSLETEAFAQLLLRAGYNNGVDDVLAMAGVRTDYMNRCQTTDSAKRLETMIMSLGYLLARNGGISTTSPAMHSAKALIAAAKQGGSDGTTAPFTASLGRAMMDELEKMSNSFSSKTNSRTLFGGAGENIHMADLDTVHTLVTGEVRNKATAVVVK